MSENVNHYPICLPYIRKKKNNTVFKSENNTNICRGEKACHFR